jgi:hypothetical protein
MIYNATERLKTYKSVEFDCAYIEENCENNKSKFYSCLVDLVKLSAAGPFI